MKGKAGFTLIELLVVIAIIAILAAVLFPVFTSAKEKGRQSTCANNMKQLSLGFRQYLDDWNSTFPGGGPLYRAKPLGANIYGEWCVARSPNATTNTMDVKRGSLWRYIRNYQVYRCPSDIHAKEKVGNYEFGVSYSMNNQLDYAPESRITSFTKTVMLIDEGEECISLTTGEKKPMEDTYFGYGIDWPGVVHCGGGNFAFCDSHVKFYTHKEYNNLKWSK